MEKRIKTIEVHSEINKNAKFKQQGESVKKKVKRDDQFIEKIEA